MWQLYDAINIFFKVQQKRFSLRFFQVRENEMLLSKGSTYVFSSNQFFIDFYANNSMAKDPFLITYQAGKKHFGFPTHN